MSQRYRALFAAYVQNISEDRKRPNVREIYQASERFEQNREQNHQSTQEKREYYLQTMAKKHAEQLKQQQVRSKQSPAPHIEMNTFNYYEKNQQSYQGKQNQTSRIQKIKTDLNVAKKMAAVKEKADAGDEKAQQYLKQMQQENALLRIQGTKVRDDVSKIQKTIKNMRQQGQQRVKKQEHQNKLKEIQKLVASGVPYVKAKKQVLGAQAEEKRY